MQFEVKKKDLSSAVTKLRNLANVLDMAEGMMPSVRIKARGAGDQKVKGKATGSLKIAVRYAEATVKGVMVKETGECLLDMVSLIQALSVSGENFSLSLKNKARTAAFKCGRTTGAVSVRTDGFDDSILTDHPKLHMHVPALKDQISRLCLKGPTGVNSDRTLHIDPKKRMICGEASESIRAVMVDSKIGESDELEAVSLSLPQAPLDALGKLLDQNCVMGYDEEHLAVLTPGFKAVIPLADAPPLEIREQVKGWLGEQENYGQVDVSVKDFKVALSDINGLVGPNIKSEVLLRLGENGTEGVLIGKSPSGDNACTFPVSNSTIKTGLEVGVVVSMFLECLSFYKDTEVRLTLYSEAVEIDLLDSSSDLSVQTTLIPYTAPAKVTDTAGGGDDTEEEEDGELDAESSEEDVGTAEEEYVGEPEEEEEEFDED